MKKILLLVCFPLLLPLAAQADVSVDINVPGVSLHLGDQDGAVTTGMATTGAHRNGGMRIRGVASASAMRVACTGTAGVGNLRHRAGMSIASRRAAAIRSTAIAIIATMTGVMTIAAIIVVAMTAAASLIRKATLARIVNP